MGFIFWRTITKHLLSAGPVEAKHAGMDLFIPSLVILFSIRAAEFMGNSLRGYLHSREVTEKRD